MKFEALFPNLQHGRKIQTKELSLVKGNGGACHICGEYTKFLETIYNEHICSEECLTVMDVLIAIGFTAAGGRLLEMDSKERIAIISAWTIEQREEAEEFFYNVQDGAMAGEYGEAHPEIICPEFLKLFGCHNIAATEAMTD